MVHLSIIEARLSKLGIRCGWFSRPELIELQHILCDDEEIISLVNGRYFAGFATMVATDLRILIIDKRPFFMTYEDIRYDMISQLDFTSRLLDSTLHIYTINKQHRFTSYKYKRQLREVANYIQQRVMELRNIQAQQMMRPVVTQTAQPRPTTTRHTSSPPPQKSYRQLASRLSGRVLGPVAVRATHHHAPQWSMPNPYTGASLMVRRSNGWLRGYGAARTDSGWPATQADY